MNDQLTVGTLVVPKNITSTETGTGVDVKDYTGLIEVTQLTGTVTTGTLDGKIQDSADNSTFADVTGYTFTQIVAASDNNVQTISVDTRNVARYIRYVGTAAATPNMDIAVTYAGTKQVLS